jgi:hypothetical protein
MSEERVESVDQIVASADTVPTTPHKPDGDAEAEALSALAGAHNFISWAVTDTAFYITRDEVLADIDKAMALLEGRTGEGAGA